MIQPTPFPRPAPDPGPERPEEEQMRGILPIRIGDETRDIPTLKRARSREWKRKVVRLTASIDLPDIDEVELLEQVATLTDDLIYDLVLEFDHSNALGGRDYLDEHADDRDITDAFDAMIRSVSPKVDDPVAGFVNQVSLYLTVAWNRLAQARRARSASESATPGSPEPTDGTPTGSTSDSPTNSSSSSGATDKRPRRERRRTSST